MSAYYRSIAIQNQCDCIMARAHMPVARTHSTIGRSGGPGMSVRKVKSSVRIQQAKVQCQEIWAAFLEEEQKIAAKNDEHEAFLAEQNAKDQAEYVERMKAITAQVCRHKQSTNCLPLVVLFVSTVALILAKLFGHD